MNAFVSPPSFLGLCTKKAAIRLALEQGESAWADGYNEGRRSSDHWRDTIPASEPSYPPVTYSAILAFVLVVALLSLLLLL